MWPFKRSREPRPEAWCFVPQPDITTFDLAYVFAKVAAWDHPCHGVYFHPDTPPASCFGERAARHWVRAQE